VKISLQWINDFIDIDGCKPDKIEEQLTSLGLECNIDSNKYYFDSNVVLGKVLDVKKHPNADRLNICNVAVGEKNNLNIICGAPNVKPNILVAVAKVGAVIGEKQFKISKVKIRDVSSSGMICSGKELCLNDDHDGIMIFKEKIKIGTSLKSYLNRVAILDIDLTPNRGDCFSHLGVSREISTFINKPLKNKEPNLITSDFQTNKNISISIKDNHICKRYSAILLKNITVESSPLWLKERLNSIGCKSINNVVDVANYIMYDLGQPLHAFDYDKINGNSLIVRLAKKGEIINTINGNNLKLDSKDIVISDNKKPLALAGVIGGSNSHVTNDTKSIIIESAIFDEIHIRRSSKKYDASTESSKRFERGVDIECSVLAMKKFVEIFQSISGCKVANDFIDLYSNVFEKNSIKFNLDDCNTYLGTSLTVNEAKVIFKKLNIVVENNINNFNCKVPTYRNDLKDEVDLYEEIARIYGYDNIPTKDVFVVPYSTLVNDSHQKESLIRNCLSNAGFNEHYSNSFYSKKDVSVYKECKPIKIKNPLSQEFEYLRNSMLPGLLKAVSYNLNRKINYIKIYEIGSCQILDESKYNFSNENRHLSIIWCGDEVKHWKHSNYIDIYTIKGDLKLLLEKVGVKNVVFKYTPNDIVLELNSNEIGRIVSINKNILNNYNIDCDVFAFDMNLNKLYENMPNISNVYEKYGQFPKITRDISFIIDDKHNHLDIIDTVYDNGGKYLKEVVLFDYYINDKFKNNEKSLAYSLVFESMEKTLKDEEINVSMDNILSSLKKKYNIVLR